MLFWHDFLDSFDTDGGRIFLLFILMFLGGMMSNWNWTSKGDDIVVGAFGALLLALKVSGSNKDRREGPPMPLPANPGAPPPIAPTPPIAPVVAAVEDVAAAIRQEEPKP